MATDESDAREQTGEEGAGPEEGEETSLLREFWTFLMENKVWWITPTVVILLLVLAFIVVTAVTGGGPMAPFIYTLF